MHKQRVTYETEVDKLNAALEAEQAAISPEDEEALEKKRLAVTTYAEDVVKLQKEKADVQTQYFALRNEHDSYNVTKSELFRKLSSAQNKPSASTIQDEIALLE